MDLGVPELVIILVLVVLLFGVGRISKIAGELGSGVRAFREGLQSSEPEDEEKTLNTPAKEEPVVKVETAVNSETDEPISVDHRS